MKKTSPFHWPRLLALALCLILSAGCTKASKARRVLASADRAFQAQKYDEAEVEYKSVLRLSMLNPVALRQLGFIYFEEGRPQAAFQYLHAASKQETNNTEVQLKMAELYGESGDLKKAVELLELVVQADPASEHALALLVQWAPTNALSSVSNRLVTQLREGSPGAAACHSALGWIDLRTTNLSEAATEFTNASALDPKLASPYLGRVALCSLRNDPKGIAQALKTAAELSPVRSSTRLKYAEFKLQLGAVEEAKEIVRDMTRQAPDYIPAWLFLMRVSFAETNYDDCKASMDRILARDNYNFDAMLQAGALALAQRDGPKALSAFQHLNEVYQKAPIVKYNLARAYLINNERQKAVASLNDALVLNRDYSPAVLLLAELDYRAGKLSESATLLSQSIKNHPDDLLSQRALAETYLAQDQPVRALEVYEQMGGMLATNHGISEIQRRMGRAEFQHRMGMVYYYKLGDRAKARAAFENALAQEPGYLPTLQLINSLDISEKRFAQAHQRVAKVMVAYPTNAEPLKLQGDIYWSEGQTNQAESFYSRAIELNPEMSTAYVSLAELYLVSHQEQQALNRLGALVAKHTNDATTLNMIGVIHQAARRYGQARDAYEKVLAVDSNSLAALNNLAYVDSEFLGKVDDALKLAERARNLRPDDPRVADTLGWILFKKHEYAHALSSIQESAEKQPGDPEVQMHLGMAYYMMGEEKPARVWLERAVASKTDFLGKELARRRLEVLDIDPTKATPEVVQKLQSLVHDDPQDPVPLSRLASIQEQRGEAQKAADSLQTLLTINPQDWPAMIRLSHLYADPLKDPRKALQLAKSAHKLAPDDGRASALLGELVYRSSDYPWALSLLEDAAHRISDQPSLFYHLALAYYAVGRAADADAAMQKAVQQADSQSNLDQAKQFLALRAAVKDPAQAQASSAQVQQILAQDPNCVPALMVSALLAEQRGATNEAVQTCQKALSIYPLFAPAMRQLAILYSHSQHPSDLEKAYDWAEKARVSLPDDLELAKTLGLLTYGRADYNRSMLLLREYTKKSGDDGEAFYYLGMDYYYLKQTNACKEALQRARDLHVADPLDSEAQGILKKLK
jgi:tetratricopeptide (TPR) repeat protein